MKHLLLIGKLLAGLFLAAFIGGAVGAALGCGPAVPTAFIFGAQVLRACVNPAHQVAGSFAFEDVLTSIFTRELQKVLFADNDFYKATKLLNTAADAPGIAAASYQIPQELLLPEGVVDPAVFPLEVQELEGGNEIVTLNLLATKPTRLGDQEELEVAYDRRQSILSLHSSVLDQMAAASALNKMSQVAAGNLIRTTGAAEAAALPGLTGNRKALTKNDFIKAAELLDRTDMKGQRYALIPATMHSQLLKIDDFVSYEKTGNTTALAKGQLGELMGFKFYKRSTAAMFTVGGVAKAVGAAAASGDNEAALFWIGDAIGRVEGAAKMYINEAQAQYLGALANGAVRFGMKLLRTDKKGVVALVQDAAA
ncbi:hypothetical protein GCM10023185_06920 [Hymenobacter saemangeumensis]|uniref:Phage major capsid protein n=1 Tax=Hymenobacter saemangeumensis TaxID=1084522 RepID=A0ABP8I2L3_9BACT